MSAMAEKQLMMLKFVDQTPVLAGCSGCNLKFFVPKGLMKDPFQANNYLLSKFYRHVCTGEGPRTGGTQSSMLRTSGEVARGCAQEEGNDVDVKPRSAVQSPCDDGKRKISESISENCPIEGQPRSHPPVRPRLAPMLTVSSIKIVFSKRKSFDHQKKSKR